MIPDKLKSKEFIEELIGEVQKIKDNKAIQDQLILARWIV